jgi:hypothetical protein
MRTAADVTNVVEAANMDGRQERLEGMLVQLESCEKALQVRRARHPSLLWLIQPARFLSVALCCLSLPPPLYTSLTSQNRPQTPLSLPPGLSGDQAHCLPAVLFCRTSRCGWQCRRMRRTCSPQHGLEYCWASRCSSLPQQPQHTSWQGSL